MHKLPLYQAEHGYNALYGWMSPRNTIFGGQICTVTCWKTNLLYNAYKFVYVLSSVDLTDDSATSSKAASAVEDKGSPSSQDDDSTLSLITWNIDGLDLSNLQERARGVCSYLAL